MQEAYLSRLVSQITPDRMSPYLRAESGDTARALARYYWNVELCRAFYPILQALEISLRNNLDRAIAPRFPTEGKYDHIDSWIDRVPRVAVHYGAEDAIGKAKSQIIKDHNGVLIRDRRRHGDLVAAMSFGFWVALVGTAYDKPGYRGVYLWSPGVTDLKPTDYERLVFPKAKDVPISSIRSRLTQIRHFRNRVFHHEPVWPKRETDVDPKEQYDAICEALRWLGGEQAQLPPTLHRPPEILDHEEQIPCMHERLLTTVDEILDRARRKKEEQAARREGRRAARSADRGDAVA